MAKTPDRFRYFFVILFVCAFALNWIWEIAQLSAYQTTEKSILESLLFCTLASVIDALTILAIYRVAVFLFDRAAMKFYLTAALLGALWAVVFEKIAFTLGWWSYHEEMPRVPLLGTGLLPFMQLTTLAPLSMWAARYWQKLRTQNDK